MSNHFCSMAHTGAIPSPSLFTSTMVILGWCLDMEVQSMARLGNVNIPEEA